MADQHTGIVLRAQSVYKQTVILFDDRLGKIEGIIQRSQKLSHGALINYTVRTLGMRYVIKDIRLVELPLVWAGEHFLFFHHMLELCDYFVPWGIHCEALFKLMNFLYTHSDAVHTKAAQKKFMYAFFKRVGVHPDPQNLTMDQWIQACIQEHPQVLSLKTASFLKTLEGYEELA